MKKDNPRINDLRSAEEAAVIMDTSIANIYYWIDNKKIRVRYRGKLKMVYLKEIEKKKAELNDK